jgi:hypothetical protein
LGPWPNSERNFTADGPKQVLTNAVARMKAANHHPNSVGVQIVQIGNDSHAIGPLKDLMQGVVGVRFYIVRYNPTLKAVDRAWLILYPTMGY